jgi:hypothetical protein
MSNQQNEELYQRTIEVLKKLATSMEPVAWRQVIGRNWTYFDGPRDPREIHDSGKPCERVYASPCLTDEELSLLLHIAGLTEKDIA